jgi:hypothetical protein
MVRSRFDSKTTFTNCPGERTMGVSARYTAATGFIARG